MGIKLNIDGKDKSQMAKLAIEEQVLIVLAKERRSIMNSKARDVLIANGLSPELYAMSFSAAEDIWEAQLKPGSIAIPTPGADLSKIRGN